MASTSTPTFDELRKSIAAGRYAPVYLLHGEEGYYIDRLLEEFDKILPSDEKEFNQYTLYATQTEPSAIIDICRRVPMMAQRQVVIVKEAQGARADAINRLAPYIASPVASTVLVVAFRGAQAKGKDLLAAVRNGGGVLFESKKITEYNAPAAIGNYLRSKGLTADPKSLEMLRDFIGTDLTRLHNEIDKLATLLPSGAAVTPEVIERNIGISREYNSFELVDALAEKNAAKAFRILAYFRTHTKEAPVVLVASSVFNFFADVLTGHYAADRSADGIASELGLRNSFAAKRILKGMSNYSPVKTVEIISAIRRFDAMSKGVDSRQNEHQLLYDLVYHILTAPGRL